MEDLLLIVALLSFMYLIFTSIEFFIGFNQIKNLSKQKELAQDRLPTISIIFSALNEEEAIEAALTSLMQLDYPNFEVIAVNDRSTDQTPQIMERLKNLYPQLRVLHIKELPEGWFGKNHALSVASKQATGDWLLFTDADVVMKKQTLKKAISYVIENKVDHLTIYEHHERKQFWLKVFLLGHYVVYAMAMKPWRIRYRWSKKSLGHGAFNLVNKKVYEQCHGHEAIAMECIDDLKLGELIKKNGFKQDTVDGRDFVEREWYASLKSMIAGFEKNNFAFYNYKILPLIRDNLFAFTFYLWPFLAVILFSGPIFWLNLANISMLFLISVYVAKQFRIAKIYAFFWPAGVAILLYSMWNSVLHTYKNKGVVWRGTLYSLEKIKKIT